MMHLAYATTLLVGIACMVAVDKRYSLSFFYDARRAAITIGFGVVLFVVWDVLGIAFGVFFSGHSEYMSGWYLAKEFPIEEILFLVFLCYFTLNVYRLGANKWPHI